MPQIWELRCPRAYRSRRILFQDGLAALRRDKGVRRVETPNTPAMLCAKVVFWRDGPADDGLLWLRGEFSRGNDYHPTPQSAPARQPGRTVAVDFESLELRIVASAGVQPNIMGASVPAAHCGLCGVMCEQMRSINDAAHLAAVGTQEFIDRYGYRRRSSAELPRINLEELARRFTPLRNVPITVSEPEFVGRIPVRTEITVLGPDEPRERPIGWTILENTGISVTNQSLYPHLNPRRHEPIPDWCVMGRWVFSDKLEAYARVKAVYSEAHQVLLRFWRGGKPRKAKRIFWGWQIRDDWRPCSNPKPIRKSWWEDLGSEFWVQD